MVVKSRSDAGGHVSRGKIGRRDYERRSNSLLTLRKDSIKTSIRSKRKFHCYLYMSCSFRESFKLEYLRRTGHRVEKLPRFFARSGATELFRS